MSDFKDSLDVISIYVAEAHPSDNWNLNQGLDDAVCYKTPKTLEEKMKICADFVKRYDFPVNNLFVDLMDNNVQTAYRAANERLIIVQNKKVVVDLGPGPWFYDHKLAREHISKILKKSG